MGSESVANGDGPHSQFLNHLTSYPVVSDGITTYKSNPYGAKTISVASQAVNIITINVYQPLSPYLKGPYSIVAPYVVKADSLGDTGLTKLESRFPIVKEDTATVQKTVTSLAGYPLELANEGKTYVLKVYDERYGYHEGKNKLVRMGFAAFDTQITIMGKTFETLANYIHQKTEESKAKFEEKKRASTNNN